MLTRSGLQLFAHGGRRKRVGRHPGELFDLKDFEPAIHTRLLILQPTPFCNLDCDYCYLPDRNNRARMSLSTIRLAAARLRDDGLLGRSLTVVWHAGEPLVLPPRYYEDAFAAIAETIGTGCSVFHSIQTNGVLVDDRWCELFKRHQVRVGISVDGPAFIHDCHRVTRSGKGTHALVLKGLETLRRNEVPHHAIAVVTAESLAHADAIHAFFVDQEIHEVGFNFDEAEGPHRVSSLAGRDEGHRAFIERMLHFMIASGGSFQVREFANAFRLIATELPRYRWRGKQFPENGQTMPFAIITVAWNGDFSTFSPELLGQPNSDFANFILGNVADGGYIESTQGQAFRSLWAAVQRGVDQCSRSCAHFHFCGGGAPANKLYENGALDTEETLYCRTMIKRPFDAVLARLEAPESQTSANVLV